MKRRFYKWNVLADEGGQALTEFAIVMPVVLLFFFAILQYFQIVRAAQLCNYAAYVAARTYAVQAAIDTSSDKKNALSLAADSAALALAPVAAFVPGEFGLSGSSFNPTPDRTGLAGLVEGYVVARYVRLNSRFGGSVNITTSGSPLQVDVVINYPQPVYMPGLSGLWAIAGGGGKIKEDLGPLSEGLGGITGLAGTPNSPADRFIGSEPKALQFLDSGNKWGVVASQVAAVVGNLASQVVPFPYVNVQGKCSMGYESWGSKDTYDTAQKAVNKFCDWGDWGSSTKWQPREPKQ